MTDQERKRQIAEMNAYAHSCETCPGRTEQEHEGYVEQHWKDHWPTAAEFRQIISMPPPPTWFKLTCYLAALERLKRERSSLQQKKRPSEQDVADVAILDQQVAWFQEECRRHARKFLTEEQ
jgi:hypothetical protein